MWRGPGFVFCVHLLRLLPASPPPFSSAAAAGLIHTKIHLEAAEEQLLMRYGTAALKVGGARSFPSRFHVVAWFVVVQRMVQRRSGAAAREAKADFSEELGMHTSWPEAQQCVCVCDCC